MTSDWRSHFNARMSSLIESPNPVDFVWHHNGIFSIMLVLLVVGPCSARLFRALFFSEGLWFMFELRQIIIGLPLTFRSFSNSGGWKTGSCSKRHRTLLLGRALFQMKFLSRLRVFLSTKWKSKFSISLSVLITKSLDYIVVRWKMLFFRVRAAIPSVGRRSLI